MAFVVLSCLVSSPPESSPSPNVVLRISIRRENELGNYLSGKYAYMHKPYHGDRPCWAIRRGPWMWDASGSIRHPDRRPRQDLARPGPGAPGRLASSNRAARGVRAMQRTARSRGMSGENGKVHCYFGLFYLLRSTTCEVGWNAASAWFANFKEPIRCLILDSGYWGLVALLPCAAPCSIAGTRISLRNTRAPGLTGTDT